MITRIKFCGIRRDKDIQYVNELKPEYIGFVFYKPSKRYVALETARELKALLDPAIQAVGVFVDEEIDAVADMLEQGVIDMAQLHGHEDEAYIKTLQNRTRKPVIKAFKIKSEKDIEKAKESAADFVLLDSGYGTGRTFDWSVFNGLDRAFFLAGGLSTENVREAVELFEPYAVDLSSAIETDGVKDRAKMQAFSEKVRGF